MSSARWSRTADAVVNVAAETHVDRSILDPEAFLRTGVIGVHVLLEAVRRETERARTGERRSAPRFLQVSTDEVYGEIADGRSVETDALAPRSPYAAAKAASELLVRAYHVTYGLDVVLTRGSNTYGPFQHPEKLIPLFVTNALAGEPLPMYGDGMQIRDWLYVCRPRRGDRVRAAPRRVGRGVQPRRRERAAEPRGHRPAAGGDGPRLVAGPVGAGSPGARPPVRDGRLEGCASLGWRARVAVRRGPARRPSPGTASTATGSRPPDPATGTPTTRASTGTDSPPARRSARPAERCGSRSPARRAGSVARSSRRSRTRRSRDPRGPSPGRGPELDLDTLTVESVGGTARARPARRS